MGLQGSWVPAWPNSLPAPPTHPSEKAWPCVPTLFRESQTPGSASFSLVLLITDISNAPAPRPGISFPPLPLKMAHL